MDEPTRTRVAVVTGAASGIGRATALALHARGWQLVLWDRAADVHAVVGAAMSEVVDVTDEESVSHAAAQARAAHGGIDVLVHCAGILNAGPFAEVAAESHRRVVDVNLWGTINVAHGLLSALRERRGAMLLMGSASGFYGAPEFASYGATKAGVIALGEALRIELEADGVTVATCNPLFVAGPMVASQQHEARFVRSEGLRHTPEQLAEAIVRWAERPRGGMVWPSFAPRRIHLLSRYLAFAAHRLMRREWRTASRA